MPRLSDMMSAQDWEKAQERFKKRIEGERDDVKVSPEIYLTAEFGYYYGWEAMKAIFDNEITLDKVFVLLEGARKVGYKKLVEQASAFRTSIGSALAPTKSKSKTAFELGMKPFEKEARIDE